MEPNEYQQDQINTKEVHGTGQHCMFDVGWEIGRKPKKIPSPPFHGKSVTEAWFLIICSDQVVTECCFR